MVANTSQTKTESAFLYCWYAATQLPSLLKHLQEHNLQRGCKSISALQKQTHVYKNKTSMLRPNNVAWPTIRCSLSLTTLHTPGVSRPSFMFKDYLLIQNVQEHETTGKGPKLWGWGGGGRDVCLYLFVGFQINPLEHSDFPLFSGHVLMF